MDRKRIIVVGFKGKMGSLIFERLKRLGFDVVGVDLEDDINLVSYADLVVDFASAKSSVESALWCKNHRTSLIVGATGQTDEELKIIESASQKVAVCKAGNFSVGVAKMKQMLKLFEETRVDDCVVFEKHHKNKIDSPSGTAKELKLILENVTHKDVQVLCERGGKEIGTHVVDFYFGDELLSVKHQAFSRDAFVDGVIVAVQFMLKNKEIGMFDFENILMQKA